MKTYNPITACCVRWSVLTVLAFALVIPAEGGHKKNPPVNSRGMPVLDSQGHHINYRKGEIDSHPKAAPNKSKTFPQSFGPAGGASSLPFWQYAIFGSGIGGCGIDIGPAPSGGGAREIIVGGNSTNNFGGDDFWYVIRHNSVTGNYDHVFVSPLYPATVVSLRIGNVIGDAQNEIAVTLADGHIYFYDLATRVLLNSINTGINGIQALTLADLDGDGYSELIATTTNNLYVFNNTGSVLWQVAGAGGSDVVAGQMDNDPAIEIATTSGRVVDAATHTVQWTYSAGFGSYLKLAPLPGASYQQLIAALDWDFVYAYDVATQLPRWSLPVFDIDAIEVADVDNDGTPELIIGDGQWGTVHVHDLITQAMKWETDNPDHGVTNIAVGDVDNDGVVDLLWGAGWTDTGSDHLYVASTAGSHAIKWQSVDLQGPFLGPVVGELDGTWPPEVVICSSYSESEYESGRILVFDSDTFALRGMSAGVINNLAWEGVRDLKLRDVDGDGRKEIIVAGDYLYDGAIEIYGFNPNNTFTLRWSNTTRPDFDSFDFVDVVDLDGNGTPEVVGAAGVYLYIYDYPSGSNPWRSVAFSGQVTGLVVDDITGNGSKKIVALCGNGDLYTFDGSTRELEGLVQQSGGTIITSRITPAGLIRADSNGLAHFLLYSNNSYTESFTRQLGSAALDGVSVLPNDALWTGTNGAVNLRVPPTYDTVEWQGPSFSTRVGRFVATANRNGQAQVFTSAQHAVAGFGYESSLVTPTPGPSPTPVTTVTPSASPTATATPTHTPTPIATPTPHTPTPTATATVSGPAKLVNISTRLHVLTDDNALIGGFIVTGNTAKRVIVRAIGPSLGSIGVPDALADPMLELHGPAGFNTITNDNWRDFQESEIEGTGLAPSDDLESAIVAMLPPGAYTAIVRGNNNQTGVGLVEAYDLNSGADAKLANISTRGFVDTGDNAMIGGMIVSNGTGNASVLIRGIGPSLAAGGVANALSDPTLELHNSNGATIAVNDNWRDTQQAEIEATGIPPTDDLESAMIQTLTPGAYTAILQGNNQTTGVALVEAYQLANPTPIPTPTPTPMPVGFGLLSSRMMVGTGDSRSFNAFVISGSGPKQVLLRGIGPSLIGQGVPNAMANPVMELHGPSGFQTIFNDNWRDTQGAAIKSTGLAPTNDLESAILITLNPGAYTVIVFGTNNGTGVALNEIYDLTSSAPSTLNAVGTRAQVLTGNEILISGIIMFQNSSIIIRGLGPSLASGGIAGSLPDPKLELRDSSGTLIRADDDWQDNPKQAAEILANGLAPVDPQESAIYEILAPGAYTALVSGNNSGTGIGKSEFYLLPYSGPILP